MEMGGHRHSFPALLTAARLALCRYDASHAADILEVVNRNRERLLESFPSMARDLRDKESAASYVLAKNQDWDAGRTFCYGVWLRLSGELIGQIQVKNIVWDVPSAELGYFIGEAYQRQGFAIEAVAEVLKAAFNCLAFSRIFVRIVPTNQGSLSLAAKLGFRQEGILRSSFRSGSGELHDVICLALTKAEYQAQGSASRRNT